MFTMTGAWHMDYNFTDSQERSDRRYIPMSLALLKEGNHNNPDEVDLYSDMAFVHYFRKIQDFPEWRDWEKKGWNVVSAKTVVDEKQDELGLKDQTNFDRGRQRRDDYWPYATRTRWNSMVRNRKHWRSGTLAWLSMISCLP